MQLSPPFGFAPHGHLTAFESSPVKNVVDSALRERSRKSSLLGTARKDRRPGPAEPAEGNWIQRTPGAAARAFAIGCHPSGRQSDSRPAVGGGAYKTPCTAPSSPSPRTTWCLWQDDPTGCQAGSRPGPGGRDRQLIPGPDDSDKSVGAVPPRPLNGDCPARSGRPGCRP